MITSGDLQKVEKIHQEGDYWQKVEERKIPLTKNRVRVSAQPRTIQIRAVENIETGNIELQPKKSRTRKKKAE
ncbi:MAG: hypothetical protein PHE77_02700 [Candidatus Pacebacteria bacterium]|nr:hypothetical protein [Candidatus Paceibacterota bacterium]